METLTLESGLYVTATPLGNVGDISSRAVATLKAVDTILAEDTRVSGRLLKRLGIDTPLAAFHDHNEGASVEKWIAALKGGAALALISDAGTPLISDPGYKLVRAAREAKLAVYTIPGPSALAAAISISGQPTDALYFGGFLPNKQKARQETLCELTNIKASLVFYESPKRLIQSLADMAEILGAERPVTILREMTKIYEEALYGTIASVAAQLAQREGLKGEIVIVLGPPPPSRDVDFDVDAALRTAMRDMSLKDAVQVVHAASGASRQEVYQRALALKAEHG